MTLPFALTRANLAFRKLFASIDEEDFTSANCHIFHSRRDKMETEIDIMVKVAIYTRCRRIVGKWTYNAVPLKFRYKFFLLENFSNILSKPMYIRTECNVHVTFCVM